MSVNKMIIVGKVGQAPRIHTFDSGNKQASFSVATDDGYKDRNNNWIDQTDWHNVVCGGYLVKKAELMQPGTTVCIEGKMKRRNYKDKDGIERTVYECHAESIDLVSNWKRKDDQQGAGPARGESPEPRRAPDASPSPAPAFTADDDVPF